MKIGLVFDGGGAKGAYQIGVWKAMLETGLAQDVTAVSGSSVGALNAALFVQGDYAKAEDVWLNKLKDLEFTGVLRLQYIVDKLLSDPDIIDMSVFRERMTDCYMAVYSSSLCPSTPPYYEYDNGSIRKYTDGQMSYYNLKYCDSSECNTLIKNCTINKKIMLATSALPLLCKPQYIEGRQYRDGGIKDNSPVKPLVFAQKCNTVIVVHLDPVKDQIDKSMYPGTNIYEIFPAIYPGGIFSGTINFSNNKIRMLLDAGYNDTIGLFKSIKDLENNINSQSRLSDKYKMVNNQSNLYALKNIALIDSVLEK